MYICTRYLLGNFFHPYFCQLLHQSHHQNLKHLQKRKKIHSSKKEHEILQSFSVSLQLTQVFDIFFEMAEYIKNLDTTLKIKSSIQFGSSHILSPLKLHGSFVCKLKNCMSRHNSSSIVSCDLNAENHLHW